MIFLGANKHGWMDGWMGSRVVCRQLGNIELTRGISQPNVLATYSQSELPDVI